MTIKNELLEIPDALRRMLEEGLPSYDAAVRSVSWGEKPIFMVGNDSSFLAALSGAWAFENLAGLPVIVRRPAVFNAYTTRTLAVRSLVIVVGSTGECKETLKAVKNAKNRGAIVWAVTSNPASELAGLADTTLDCYPGDSAREGIRSAFCQHAVMLVLAVAAARILKAPGTLISTQMDELGRLATHLEWVLTQITDAGASLAKELGPLPALYVVGAGALYPIALQAACHLRELAGVRASGHDLMHFQQTIDRSSQPGEGILYLSSSRCRLKEQVHEAVRNSRQKGRQKLLAITDRNDRLLSERADMAVLLPVLTEAGSALLSLTFLDLAVCYAAQSSTRISMGTRQVG